MAKGGSSNSNQHAQADKASSSESSRVGGGGRVSLKDIAASTLKVIEHGSYEVDGISYDLKEKIDLLKTGTVYYAADSDISEWSSIPQELADSESKVHVTVSECSTLAGARELRERLQSSVDSADDDNVVERVGVLCFGSAKNPGGGFINGAQAQVICFLLSFSQESLTSTSSKKKRKNRLRAHRQYIPV